MKTVSILLTFFLWSGLSQAQVVEGMSGLIQSTDSVVVTVHREPDLNARGQLARDGTLSIPLIGSVRLAGKTTAAAESFIESKFRDGYLVRPVVSVLITNRVEKTVTVNGHVTDSGVFKIPNGQSLTLRQVISMAGGATDIANLKKVTLSRKTNGRTYMINLKMIMENRANDITLVEGDAIYVPEGYF